MLERLVQPSRSQDTRTSEATRVASSIAPEAATGKTYTVDEFRHLLGKIDARRAYREQLETKEIPLPPFLQDRPQEDMDRARISEKMLIEDAKNRLNCTDADIRYVLDQRLDTFADYLRAAKTAGTTIDDKVYVQHMLKTLSSRLQDHFEQSDGDIRYSAKAINQDGIAIRHKKRRKWFSRTKEAGQLHIDSWRGYISIKSYITDPAAYHAVQSTITQIEREYSEKYNISVGHGQEAPFDMPLEMFDKS